MTKADMTYGTYYKMRNGGITSWSGFDKPAYYDDLTYLGSDDFDIIEVYELSPVWTRPERKYYLRAEGAKDLINYLNIHLPSGELELYDNNYYNEDFNTEFTESEIAELPEWCQYLTREEVER